MIHRKWPYSFKETVIMLAIWASFTVGCLCAHAAGTCTVSNITTTQIASESNRIADPEAVIVTVACTADASAGTFPAVTIPITGSYPSKTILNSYNLTGYLLYQVGRTPGGTQPTASYTTVITDSSGFAIDLGLLTTNGNASTPQLTSMSLAAAPYPIFPTVRGALTVQISANSVNSAVITLDLIFRTRI